MSKLIVIYIIITVSNVLRDSAKMYSIYFIRIESNESKNSFIKSLKLFQKFYLN